MSAEAKEKLSVCGCVCSPSKKGHFEVLPKSDQLSARKVY